MATDLKAFLRIREAVERLDAVARSIQDLVDGEKAPPGLSLFHTELEGIRRQVEALGQQVIEKEIVGS